MTFHKRFTSTPESAREVGVYVKFQLCGLETGWRLETRIQSSGVRKVDFLRAIVTLDRMKCILWSQH